MPVSQISQYRKSVGNWDARPNKITGKSITAAFKKARNASDAPQTRRSGRAENKANNHPFGTVVKVVLIATVMSSCMSAVNAMENGVRNTNEKAQSTFPQLGVTGYKLVTSCSGLKINNRQIVSAKHCGKDRNIWAYDSNGRQTWERSRVEHPIADLAIYTFAQDLKGSTSCLGFMTQQTQSILKNAAKDVCGLGGRVIINGRGAGNSEVFQLFSGVFDFKGFKRNTGAITSLKGVEHNGASVCIRPGDSGAPVLACNPTSGEYEVMGFSTKGLQRGSKVCGRVEAGFVDTAFAPELTEWIVNNTEPCVPTPNHSVTPQDLRRSNNHHLDRCKINLRDDEAAGISKKERCSCYYQSPKYEAPPAILNCPPHNKGEAVCVDIAIDDSHLDGRQRIRFKNNCNSCVHVGIAYNLVWFRNFFVHPRGGSTLQKGQSMELVEQHGSKIDVTEGISFKHCGDDFSKATYIPNFFLP